MRILDPVVLAQLGRLALQARTVVEGALTGLHRSPHHGSSIEFAEHKEYTPGDEIRHIDWKAYGKFDRYYVKKFEEETELTAYLLLDRSGSMAYRGAGPSKLEVGIQLCAALAHLLIRQQDRVGLLAFGGEAEPRYVPPRAGSQHLHDLLATLVGTGDEGGKGPTSLGQALDRLAEITRRRRALVILVSDLFDPDPDVPARLRRLRAQRHDVTVVHLLDKDELELPFEGMTRFESLEDDRRLLVDPQAVRRAYLDELNAFLTRTRVACAEGDVLYQLVSTAEPLDRVLRDLITARHARGRNAARRAS